MDTLIDFAFLHFGELFCIGLGIGVILYSCFTRRFTFEEDVAVKSEGRQFYEATAPEDSPSSGFVSREGDHDREFTAQTECTCFVIDTHCSFNLDADTSRRVWWSLAV